jgi:hypothetical protein
MTENALTYHVDNGLIEGYIKKSGKRQFYLFFTVIVCIVTFQSLITYQYASDAPRLFIIGVAIMMCAIALFFSIRLLGNKLRTFAGASYVIERDLLSQQTPGNKAKHFKFNEIAVIHEKSYGTLIVKGGKLTKLNYYRPKRNNPYPVDSANVIFVPTITTNYSGLIERIKQLTKAAE